MNAFVKFALENIAAPRLHLDFRTCGEMTVDELEALYVVVHTRYEDDLQTSFSAPCNPVELIDHISSGKTNYAKAIVARLLEMRIEATYRPAPLEVIPADTTTEPQNHPQKNRNFSKRPVAQYECATGKKLGEFPSVTAAKLGTGVCDSSISACCNGRYATAGGYIWKYA